MRFRSLFATLVAAILIMPAALAKDVYLSVAGSVGVFRTDTRILNPSGTTDINVTATFLPARGNVNPQVTRELTIGRRSMAVHNDIVASLFNTSGLGAVRLFSLDDFVATQRIYAVSENGTLGQFVPGLDATAAKLKGVLLQLKSGASGTGTFRTNVGMVNPNNAVATVTFRVYDRNNTIVGQPKIETLQPSEVISPREITGYLEAPAGSDLSDAWVSYTSDQPIFAYGSVVDNGTTDPTFVPAFEDTGEAVILPPTARTFDIVASQWNFAILPGGSLRADVGDIVTLRISSEDVVHGFAMPPYVQSITISPGSPEEVTFTVTDAGTFTYVCTVSSCGSGHGSMSGRMTVVEGKGSGGYE